MTRIRATVPVCLLSASLAALAGCAPLDGEGDDDLLGKADGYGREAALDEELLAMAIGAAELARSEGHGTGRPEVLTIVDFSLSSAHKRLWVIDLGTNEILYNERVAHGLRSGTALTATSFSNVSGSNKSSIGLFEVNELGVGGSVGPYIAVDGLEPGWNSAARAREILIHGASYASDSYYRSNGYTGRSHGCFAVRPDFISTLRRAISGGSLLFAYYPDEDYLASSDYASNAPSTPWVGTTCAPGDDGECSYTYGEERGFCWDGGGYCSMRCEGRCPDRYGHAETFCVEGPDGTGICVPKAGVLNHDCADIPGTEARSADRFVGASGVPARTSVVCLPSS